MTRYLEIAEDIARLIEAGSLQPGDALPSVRKAAEERKVSKNTVVQAYSLLEARRVIEAKPQSGFYVRATALDVPKLPRTGLTRPSVVRVGKSDRLRETLGDLVSARVTSLGSSFVDPSLFPIQSLNRALSASSRQGSYAKTLVDLQLGLPALRRAIAQRYLELGYAVPMDEIVITCGGMEAISLSLQALARPGDLVLIDSPMFFSGLQLLKQLGLSALEMPTDPEAGLDLSVLDKTLSRHKVSACLLMTNCQNPLGFSMSESKKRELAKLLRKHDVPLVENDVYAELQFDLQRSRAAKAFDTQGTILHCGSFTKCLAPGFKIGWVAAGRYREAIANRKFATTLGTSVPPQAAIAYYLLHHAYERHLRSLRQQLQSRVSRMSEAVFEHFPVGTRVSRPQGGFVLWIQMPDDADSQQLFELAAAKDIGIAPGPIFSAREGYRNFIRLNCSHPWSDSLDSTLHWLGQSVKAMCR
ncbi:PLP-dependent aminotransferase family protein [Cupriavidus consociatus]|uniref:aminotransferase-like domain-containing protein n=1 Tax=Cupriavidus consociatus TaxID=2821357 RepID=UPI001AE4BCA4|nr:MULTISPECIES: PLP-dependent aminotransferase family protein [unclassified Cupriavidus]MBP0625083.1 PLP-dependent aminotransferase family protein [Cupriavidus sp. LEh25]MDK2661819.1 PLP-dependent aminotransferase family protein [Cupriavidus sp. LEh21]